MNNLSKIGRFLLLVAVLLLFAAGCGATDLESVDASLLGEWSGAGMVQPPITFTPSDDDSTRLPKQEVELHLIIRDDASVTGSVGGAELRDCVLKRNRSELGRQLNVATDYIIVDGYLDGAIIEGDEEPHKDFTIPFNIVTDDGGGGRMRGTVMWLKENRYPLPLTPVDLERQ